MNINNAYLNSDLNEKIYMMLLFDYSFIINIKDKVLLLQKGLYNFKQSTRK